jgi:hypothetical protein
MNLGDMTSRELGRLTSDVSGDSGKRSRDDKLEGDVPGTAKNQNLGHNSKKEGLGPNTKR